MVFKSIGKALGLGKNKDKKDDAPKVTPRVTPTKGDDKKGKPVLGGHRAKAKVDPKAKTVIGSHREKGDGKKGKFVGAKPSGGDVKGPQLGGHRRAWKKGESDGDEGKKSGIVLGSRGKAKEKVEEKPKVEEPSNEGGAGNYMTPIDLGPSNEGDGGNYMTPLDLKNRTQGGGNYSLPVDNNYANPEAKNYLREGSGGDGNYTPKGSNYLNKELEGGDTKYGAYQTKYFVYNGPQNSESGSESGSGSGSNEVENKYLKKNAPETGINTNYGKRFILHSNGEESSLHDSQGNYKQAKSNTDPISSSTPESSEPGEVDHQAELLNRQAMTKAAMLARVREAKRKKLEEEAKKRANERREAKRPQKPEMPGQKDEEGGSPEEQIDKTVEVATNYLSAGSASNYTAYSQINSGMYGNIDGPQEQLSISSSISSSSSIETSRVGDPSAHTGEIDQLDNLEDEVAPMIEVQEKYGGSDKPETREMQAKMREGRRYLHDTPENVHGKEVAVNRDRLSPNERNSEGWALLGLREDHRTRDLGKSKTSQEPWQVKYAVSQVGEISKEVQTMLGQNMLRSRESMLLTMKDGLLQNAKGENLDTSSGGVLGQAQNERMQVLRKKIEEAKKAGLGDKVSKLEQKLDTAWHRPQQDKNISGKFIYVMNAKGEFFATKPEVFKIHHSTMLAGGAVACAGEISVSGGKINAISNLSGHYRPGPAYLWQAVQQLKMDGMPMSFRVDCAGVSKKYKSGDEFLGAMDPTADPLLHDAAYALKFLNGKQQGL